MTQTINHELRSHISKMVEKYYKGGWDYTEELAIEVEELVQLFYGVGYRKGHYDAVYSIMNGEDVSDTGEVG